MMPMSGLQCLIVVILTYIFVCVFLFFLVSKAGLWFFKRYSIIRVYNNFVLQFCYILLNVTTSCGEEIDTNKRLNIIGSMVCQSIQSTSVANSVDPV